ncbi:MAG: hypothetical protein HQL52_05295 [Magnetococcales bacterium]|nr:hypothetical protein [Magnetococcales bacterium]
MKDPLLRIGIDFDNTIACYDTLFGAIAQEQGWLGHDGEGELGKKAVRDQVRALEEGEGKWQWLQAQVYGRRMGEAMPMPGVEQFFGRCREKGIEVTIISHKTRFAAADPQGVDLRQAARAWMEIRGFFDPDGFHIPLKNLYFESTRANKIHRIKTVSPSHFIDDLEEIFRDPGFPEGVERLLFHPNSKEISQGPYKVCRSWREIGGMLIEGGIGN